MSYIEREAILSYPIRADHCDKKHANEHFIFGIESVMEFVENLPAAEVAPVRHGRWKEVRDAYGKLEGWLCECGREVKSKDNYCPNCGARMDKEDENEAD